MFPKIEKTYVKSDPVAFRAQHYWTEATKELKHLRRPHEHKFSLTLAVSARGENREIACEEITDLLMEAAESIPYHFPWSCETLGRKILNRIILQSIDSDPEMHVALLHREFIVEVLEGEKDQGVILKGRFAE